MHPYGGDRLRNAGGKIILQAAIPKGWVARKPKGVHAEYPGTAVLWDGEYFEVITAERASETAVRYVLEPWRDDHVIRDFQQYDEATEARRLADHRAAAAQRKKSVLSRLSGIVLGHFPVHVQEHLQNEFGVTPSRMTIVSCIPSVVLLGACVWFQSEAKLEQVASPVPFWLGPLALLLVLESAIRFLVAMTQGRGIGSMLGTLGYVLVWYAMPIRRSWPSPFDPGRGHKSFTLPPSDEVALRDSLEMRAPWFTLLSVREQERLAERFGYDYRQHASAIAWLILTSTTLGVVRSVMKIADGGTLSTFVSLIVAGGLAIEQVRRLGTFKRGPAGSVLGIFVRPFVRRFLERG